jgi:catechol 2,3-dioxygenase-like lactoylglutathione lyase family enzyme
MPASLEFYRGILGFEVAHDSGQGDKSGWVMLRLNDVYMMLNTQFDDADPRGEPDPVRTIAHNDTVLYFSTPDPDAVYKYLREKGLEIDRPKNAPYGDETALPARSGRIQSLFFRLPYKNNLWTEK